MVGCVFFFDFGRVLRAWSLEHLSLHFHLSNVQNPVDIPLYWLVDRDPYNGSL